MPCAFGGQPQVYRILQPRLFQAPARAYRIIPGKIWWRLVHWGWRKYKARVAAGLAQATAPALAPLNAAGVYCTDRPSLRGCHTSAHFAHRLSLTGSAQLECQLYGCAVVEFAVPPGAVLLPLPALPGAPLGLTGGGARQWLLAGNLALNPNMRVRYIESAGTRPYYTLPL